jgi:hypothetical protein
MSKLQLAAIMAPANQAYWWYYSQTAAQVAQLLTQNKAMPTSGLSQRVRYRGCGGKGRNTSIGKAEH